MGSDDLPGAKELDDILTSGEKALPSKGICLVRNDLIELIAWRLLDEDEVTGTVPDPDDPLLEEVGGEAGRLQEWYGGDDSP